MAFYQIARAVTHAHRVRTTTLTLRSLHHGTARESEVDTLSPDQPIPVSPTPPHPQDAFPQGTLKPTQSSPQHSHSHSHTSPESPFLYGTHVPTTPLQVSAQQVMPFKILHKVRVLVSFVCFWKSPLFAIQPICSDQPCRKVRMAVESMLDIRYILRAHYSR